MIEALRRYSDEHSMKDSIVRALHELTERRSMGQLSWDEYEARVKKQIANLRSDAASMLSPQGDPF